MSDEIAQLIAEPENAKCLLYVNKREQIYNRSRISIRRDRMLNIFRKVFSALWPNDPLFPVKKWHDHPKVFVWAQSNGGGILVTAQDWIGAIPFDGATARFYLRGPDGTRVSTWLGEDYSHDNIEITIDGASKNVEFVLADAMTTAGWPPR